MTATKLIMMGIPYVRILPLFTDGDLHVIFSWRVGRPFIYQNASAQQIMMWYYFRQCTTLEIIGN